MVDMSNVKLRIENIVASVDLFTQLNLERVIEMCPPTPSTTPPRSSRGG